MHDIDELPLATSASGTAIETPLERSRSSGGRYSSGIQISGVDLRTLPLCSKTSGKARQSTSTRISPRRANHRAAHPRVDLKAMLPRRPRLLTQAAAAPRATRATFTYFKKSSKALRSRGFAAKQTQDMVLLLSWAASRVY